MDSVNFNYSTMRVSYIDKFEEIKLSTGKILSINHINNFYIIFIENSNW